MGKGKRDPLGNNGPRQRLPFTVFSPSETDLSRGPSRANNDAAHIAGLWLVGWAKLVKNSSICRHPDLVLVAPSYSACFRARRGTKLIAISARP